MHESDIGFFAPEYQKILGKTNFLLKCIIKGNEVSERQLLHFKNMLRHPL